MPENVLNTEKAVTCCGSDLNFNVSDLNNINYSVRNGLRDAKYSIQRQWTKTKKAKDKLLDRNHR